MADIMTWYEMLAKLRIKSRRDGHTYSLVMYLTGHVKVQIWLRAAWWEYKTFRNVPQFIDWTEE